jgi:hypothetical protein
VFLGAVLLTAYVIFHPEQLIILQQLTSRLAAAPGIEEALTVLRPWLANPVALVIALFFFSGITPVIEEAAKSLAVWVIFDRLEAPLQGFVAGAVAGAGFGLVESLLASATPDSGWAYTLLARGGSTMMHIAAAALAGWGVASLRASGRPGLLIGGYALALLIHGAWNASVIALAFGGMRLASNGGGADPLGSAFVVVGVAVLAALCVTIPTGLGVTNWRLRSGALSGPNPDSDHHRTVAGHTGIAAGEGIDQDAD